MSSRFCLLKKQLLYLYLYVANRIEFRMGFICWIAKVLDFGHGELTDANQPGAWRDLIAERVTDLGGSEWKFSLSRDCVSSTNEC